MIGKILGNCRILKKLGEGGMGSVYLARDLTLEREVALKIIAPELARRPGLMARFRVEAIAQAKLNHSHIVTIHSFDQEKDIYYIVMDYVLRFGYETSSILMIVHARIRALHQYLILFSFFHKFCLICFALDACLENRSTAHRGIILRAPSADLVTSQCQRKCAYSAVEGPNIN